MSHQEIRCPSRPIEGLRELQQHTVIASDHSTAAAPDGRDEDYCPEQGAYKMLGIRGVRQLDCGMHY